MKKKLVAKNNQDCIGCELCVMEAQMQLKKVGSEGALIRILRTGKKGEYPMYSPDVDPRISALDVEKIQKACPKGVYEIQETQDHESGL